MGSVIYSAVITRPDIACAASKLAEYLNNLGPEHLRAIDYCIQYLAATKYLAIKYSATNKQGQLVAMTDKVFEQSADTSFVNNPDRRSGEGYVFKLFDGMVDWVARKQATISTSMTEAELLALLYAGKQAIWWSNLFNKLHFYLGHRLQIYNDNRQTVQLLNAETSMIQTKLRHINISQSWLRECVQNKDFDVEWQETGNMTANRLTKLLPPQKHQHFL